MWYATRLYNMSACLLLAALVTKSAAVYSMRVRADVLQQPIDIMEGIQPHQTQRVAEILGFKGDEIRMLFYQFCTLGTTHLRLHFL